MNIVEILKQAKDIEASDILISVGVPPMLRVGGKLTAAKGHSPVTAEDSSRLVYSILRDDQKKKLETQWEIDFSVSIKELGRYRVNAYMQRGTLAAAFRVIKPVIPDLKSLGIGQNVANLSKLPRGLVLVTGPTGSGKSTLLAALVNLINQQRPSHIITLEDPIEFLHKHQTSVIDQREINSDTHSYTQALKSALRQDPDVILLGEMRDAESIQIALTIAETGHLVFSSLHTQDAIQTIDRIVDVFPPNQQYQIRNQLSTTIKGVISQILVPRRDGKGLIAAREVLIVNSAVANLVREGKTHQILSVIQTASAEGMITMENSLLALYKEGFISEEVAINKANDPSAVRKAIAALGGAKPK